jgi:large subunit ribosomal protein L17
MLSNMAASLITHKRIKTTVAKAKALRMYVEPLINRSKEDTTHSRRVVFSYLQNKDAVSELFREVAQKVANRPGGYTRILKLGNRLGDAAEMCYIELVDYNENMLAASNEAASGEAKKTTTRRSRRGGKKTADVAEAAVSATATKKPKAAAKAEPEIEDQAPEAEKTEE